MAVELEIRDGNPWWLSTDIWTVPIDPQGPPGLPTVGQDCYLWSHVRNNGRFNVSSATVRFYWANPAVGFNRNTATLIGTSFVTLDAGDSADVLCLTPWVPEYVNDGHECVLAEAFHESLDPLPSTPEFNVPTDRHVAQRNLSVVMTATGFFHFTMVIYNTERKARTFSLELAQEEVGTLKPLSKNLGPEFKIPARDGRLLRAAFVEEHCPDRASLDRYQNGHTKIDIAGNSSVGRTLVGEVDGPALLHVRQIVDTATVGGLSVLVLPAKDTNGQEKTS